MNLWRSFRNTERSFRYFVLRSQKPKTFPLLTCFTTERWHKQKLQSSGNYFIFIDKRPRCGYSFAARVCVSKNHKWLILENIQYNPLQRESFRILPTEFQQFGTCFIVSLFSRTFPICLFSFENNQSWNDKCRNSVARRK